MVTDVRFERGILFRWITPESLLNGFRAWLGLESSIRNFKWASHSKWIRHLVKKTFYVWISLSNYFIISFSEVGCTLVDGGGLLNIESVLCSRRYVYCKREKIARNWGVTRLPHPSPHPPTPTNVEDSLVSFH